MYQTLFGPVPSRRLGMSLGIDLVPHKICSLNCVYCECGVTTKLTLERKEYVDYKKIIEELKDFFSKNPDPDTITFSGSGEPTLNSRIGDIISFLKDFKKNVPIAVLTNATLLSSKEVRSELLQADIVLPSLDAASNKVFKKIDRAPRELSAEKHIKGLIDFRKEYKGKIWLEIFILPAYNDSPEELEKLKNAIEKIKPDKVQINTLDRPGTVAGLQSASYEILEKIKKEWDLPYLEIIASAAKRKSNKAYREDIHNTILETVKRRPCTPEDLQNILGLHINEINKYLDVLDKEGKVETVREQRGIFYQIKK